MRQMLLLLEPLCQPKQILFSEEVEMAKKYMKKMFHIFNHQGTANLNDTESPFHPIQNGNHQGK
jgi:hypothetical protein